MSLLRFSLMWATLLATVGGGSDNPQVICYSSDRAPLPQCESSTPKIQISTEFGEGDAASFADSSQLIGVITGPSESGDLETVRIRGQQPLTGTSGSRLIRDGDQITLIPVQEKLESLKTKNVVAIIETDSGVGTLEVDVSASVEGMDGGTAIVVADSLDHLTIKANGYTGRDGLSAEEALAEDAVLGKTSVPTNIADAYFQRRSADLTTPLPFDSTDLNAYEASGLRCDDGEVAVGVDGSYAYDNAGLRGPYQNSSAESVPAGIDVVALVKEESKRTFCQRKPEFTLAQSCEAEKEYSFRAACRVIPESRSLRVFKRDPVVWERALCASSTDARVRRKIVRQAAVQIAIPGGKSFNGTVSREIKFDETYDVLRERVVILDESGSVQFSEGGAAESGLRWYNPFWRQANNLSSDALIKINDQETIQNSYTDNLFPPADPSSNSRSKGVKLTYLPRQSDESACAGEGCPPEDEDLFAFKSDQTVWSTADPSISASNMIGCAPIIDLSGDEIYARSKVIGTGIKTEDKYDAYLRFFKAFDASVIGFTAADLRSASSIKVSGCFAFEVIEAIEGGDLVRGEWRHVSGTPDPSIPTPSQESAACIAGGSHPERVGIETFIQYEREDTCYVDDPRSPPNFLRELAGKDAGAQQFEFEVGQLSGRWTRALSSGTIKTETGTVAVGDPLTSEIDASDIQTNPVYEIIFPPAVTESERESLASGAGTLRQNFCVHYPDPEETNPGAASFWNRELNPGRWPQATRSLEVPSFAFRQGSKVATPEPGSNRRVCPSGIRLDVFLTNVPRVSCPVDFQLDKTLPDEFGFPSVTAGGSSSKLELSEWSSEFSDSVWLTFDDLAVTNTPSDYTLRSTVIDTRYDDLPTNIFTARTHQVHPDIFLGSGGIGESSTGDIFPPHYGFLGDDGSRIYPGWTRERSLVSASGALVAPDSFTPFAGSSLTQRTANWCNAEAFVELPGGGLGQGFGARGSLRDAPKRVFGFTLEQAAAGDKTSFVGVEITGVGSGGFYTESNFPTLTANELISLASQDDFQSKNFPFLGARFQEACASGSVFDDFLGTCRLNITPPTPQVNPCGSNEIYNPMRGKCQSPGESWLATTRVVERILHDVSRTPWSFPLTKQTLADSDTSKPFDYPFNLTGNNGQSRFVNGDTSQPISLTGNGIDELVQIGFLRPSKKMTNTADDQLIFLNRPETLDKMILAPGFATSLTESSAACGIRTRILAVPAVRTEPIDLSGSLPTGSAIIALDTDCSSETGFTVASSIVFLDESGIRTSPLIAAPQGTISISTGADGFERINLDFKNAAGELVYRISDLYESLVAGLSATTGQETLVAVDIEPPEVRSRSSEWIESGRSAQHGPWRSTILTGATPATTDQSASSFSCAITNATQSITEGDQTAEDGSTISVGVKTGIWTQSTADEPAILNDSVLTDEEISLFAIQVPNSETKLVTRSALTQWTPWSHELSEQAPKDQNFTNTTPFGDWAEIGSLQPGASVPDCSIYTDTTRADITLPRSSFDAVEKIEDLEVDGEPTVFRIPNPLNLQADFIVTPFSPDIRASKSCVRWDSVTGDRCEQSHSTIQGPDLAPLVFGGEWDNVFVERRERVSQICHKFGHSAEVSIVDGSPVGEVDFSRCRRGNRCVAGASAPIVTDQLGTEGPQAYNADGSCFAGVSNSSGGIVTDTAATSIGPNLEPLRAPRTEFCTPETCPFQTNTQTFQVDASVPASGKPGEDGTAAGGAIVFCRDCSNITFEARPGRGGAGSNPVSSTRSKTLTCVKSNNNPLNPVFSVRHLWSQPFVGGVAGQNGRGGAEGTGLQVYQDLTPESLWLLGRPEFYRRDSAAQTE